MAEDTAGTGDTPVRRSKRERKRNRGSDALEKIKLSRQTGIRQEEELDTPESLFELVSEEEYTKIIHKRQRDNWILDDDGTYREHGREIFDEEVSTTPIDGKPSKKTSYKPPRLGGTGNIKNMIFGMGGGAKKKTNDVGGVSVKGDVLLADLLSQIDNKDPLAMKERVSKNKSKSLFSPRTHVHVPKAPPKSTAPPSFGTRPSSKSQPRLLPSVPAVKRPEISNEELFAYSPPPEADMNCDDFDVHDTISDVLEMEDEKENKIEETRETIQRKESIPIEAVSTGWETIKEELNSQATPMESVEGVAVDGKLLPLLEDDKGNPFIRFYWLDAYEDSYNKPGTVYLFGKIWIDGAKAHVSCCVTVCNIERCLYFLPREKLLSKSGSSTDQDVSMKDVYMEFNDKFAEKHRIMKFASKGVNKKYAFELPDVPSEADYLEVRYSAHHPAPPTNVSGLSYSRVFGTNTSCLERLILGCQIKGPCWLDIKSPAQANSNVSWCKIECTADGLSSVGVASEQATPPPLTVLSLSIKTLLNTHTRTNEILSIGALIHQGVSLDKPPPAEPFQTDFCCIRVPPDRHMPLKLQEKMEGKGLRLEITPSERGLLAYFLAKFAKIDPDIVIGHNLASQWLETLQHRMFTCKVPSWSRIGRLRRTTMPKGKAINSTFCCGRLICDVKLSAKELIRSRSYDLSELASSVLQTQYQPMENEDILAAFGNIDSVCHLVSHTMEEAFLSLQLTHELCVLPLAYQITCIAGNILNRTLLGGRSERNEFLLLHAFTQQGYLPPDKQESKRNHGNEEEGEGVTVSRRGKPSYAGGLVLEPKTGFYDRCILLLDFNSLYPSIIQEYNICFTTIDHAHCTSDESIASLEPPGDSQPQGILPTQIRVLVERRRQVKQLMKTAASPEAEQQYDIRQKALKLTANSMYGCLGFSNSRFFAKPLAALITGKGRQILEQTRDLATKLGLDVIYGDTDSIMIDSGTQEWDAAMALAAKVKNEVNKLYRLLEIDVDGVFKCMLLLKKKKYAAVTLTKHNGKLIEKRELKGLDIVRRDWSDLAKRAGHFILDQILAGQNLDTLIEQIQSYLKQMNEEVYSDQVNLKEFIITKGLTKLPKDYPDKKSLPHVQVAMRMLSRQQHVQPGDVIPYIICEGEDGVSPSQRAYHPTEVVQQQLKIDYKYYLQHQVHAVVTRLCEPIAGLDAAHLAEWVGLDPSLYARRYATAEDEEDGTVTAGETIAAGSNFTANPLNVYCPDCKKTSSLTSSREKVPLLNCYHCSNRFTSEQLVASLSLSIRYYTSLYYQGWLICTNCGYRARSVTSCPTCSPFNEGILKEEYSSSDLYHQLNSFKTLCQGDKECCCLVQQYLDNNSYTRIDLSKVFPVIEYNNRTRK